MRIGFIGTGTIASAVVAGIAKDGHQITVSERSATHAERLARAYDCVTVAANQTVLDQSEVIIIGLMADTAPQVLGALSFRHDHRVISLMSGLTLAEVAAIAVPAQVDAIVIPFPGIAHGNSPIMLRGDIQVATALFGARNQIFALSNDAELAAYMCAQAVLSPVARLVGDAADWLGHRVDDPKQAEAFLRRLVGSSLQNSECAPLIEALNTAGGYNQRLRVHMEQSGFSAALAAGLDALEKA